MKSKYVKPSIELIEIETESLLAASSTDTSTDVETDESIGSAGNGGAWMAKPDQPSIWDE